MTSDVPLVVHRFRSVTSTQDEAQNLIEDGRARLGHVVIADVQEAGRGRFGRTWLSPTGGLYATFIVRGRPTISVDAAVAAVRALSRCGANAKLKWPNDLLLQEKKLGGILIEATDAIALVGIGINLTETPLETAVSLREAGVAVRRGTLAIALAEELAEADGADVGFYRDHLVTLGQSVRIAAEDGRTIEGTAVDVDDGGRLIVETSDGPKIVSTGECVHLRS